MYKKIFKRLFDIIGGSVAIILLLPVFFVVSVLIFFKMGNPILFKHRRTGFKMAVFSVYKFRTMIDDPLLSDEQRITKLGLFLRSYSLDELPQFFNVVLGNMSLIGPRPLLPEYDDHYSPEQKKRFDVRPGISGLAQVKGRNSLEWVEKFDYDIQYSKNVSFILDMVICFKTVLIVFKSSDFNPAGEVKKFSDL
jgi:undecaprenyl phosphate N,N'-diacetylbacillosamine 1-phosphate transferase